MNFVRHKIQIIALACVIELPCDFLDHKKIIALIFLSPCVRRLLRYMCELVSDSVRPNFQTSSSFPSGVNDCCFFFFFSYGIWHKYFLFAFRCSHLKAGYHANDLMLLIIWSTHSYFWRFFFSFCISNLLDFQDMCVCAHTHAHAHTQLCFTLCDPPECSPPGHSVHGIFQARM